VAAAGTAFRVLLTKLLICSSVQSSQTSLAVCGTNSAGPEEQILEGRVREGTVGGHSREGTASAVPLRASRSHFVRVEHLFRYRQHLGPPLPFPNRSYGDSAPRHSFALPSPTQIPDSRVRYYAQSFPLAPYSHRDRPGKGDPVHQRRVLLSCEKRVGVERGGLGAWICRPPHSGCE
jgi:hypothetical protein